MKPVGLILAFLALPLVEGYTLWRVWSSLILPYIDGAPVLGAVPFTGLVLTVGLLRYDGSKHDQSRAAHNLFLRYFTCMVTQIMVAMLSIGVG